MVLLDAKIKNAQKLFCEENIELEVKEDKLVTEYFEITGGLIGIWDGGRKNDNRITILFTRFESVTSVKGQNHYF